MRGGVGSERDAEAPWRSLAQSIPPETFSLRSGVTGKAKEPEPDPAARAADGAPARMRAVSRTAPRWVGRAGAGVRGVQGRATASSVPSSPEVARLLALNRPERHPRGSPEERVRELGLVLDGRLPANPQGIYHPVVLVDTMAQVSGQVPRLPDGSLLTGTAGSTATEEEAVEAARACGITMLATLRDQLGTLDRVKRVVKVNGYVASTPDFTRQPAVVNAVSARRGRAGTGPGLT